MVDDPMDVRIRPMDVRVRRLVMMGHDYDTHNRVIVMDQDEKIQLSIRTTPWAEQVLVIDFYGNIHGVRKCVPSPQNVVRPTGPRKEDGVQWSNTTLHYISGPGIQTELYERHDLFVLPNFHDTTPLFKRILCPTFFDSRVPVCTLSDFGIFSRHVCSIHLYVHICPQSQRGSHSAIHET